MSCLLLHLVKTLLRNADSRHLINSVAPLSCFTLISLQGACLSWDPWKPFVMTLTKMPHSPHSSTAQRNFLCGQQGSDRLTLAAAGSHSTYISQLLSCGTINKAGCAHNHDSLTLGMQHRLRFILLKDAVR